MDTDKETRGSQSNQNLKAFLVLQKPGRRTGQHHSLTVLSYFSSTLAWSVKTL